MSFLQLEGIGTSFSSVDNPKKVGAERCSRGSDFEELFNPHQVDGFWMFVWTLLKRGISEKEMDRLTRKNPARLPGLENGAGPQGTCA